MNFQPDYRHFEDVMANKRPARLPLYEHIVSPSVMEQILNIQFEDLLQGDASDINEFFKHYCGFFKEMTYDVVSFEVCICDILPGGGAILGERWGPFRIGPILKHTRGTPFLNSTGMLQHHGLMHSGKTCRRV